MKDKERILTNIICRTGDCLLESIERDAKGWRWRMHYDSPSPQFVPLEQAASIGLPLVSGDIVRCQTNPNHDWGISEFVKIVPENGIFGSKIFLLKEIGSDRLMRMENESFYVLRFMPPDLLLAGKKYRLFQWSQQAFSERWNPKASYWIRWGGCEFNNDCMKIWARPHIWHAEKMVDGKRQFAQPRQVIMKWNKKTRFKDIIEMVNLHGIKEEWEYSEISPTKGLQGCIKLTREDLLKAIRA